MGTSGRIPVLDNLDVSSLADSGARASFEAWGGLPGPRAATGTLLERIEACQADLNSSAPCTNRADMLRFSKSWK
jgi:hypothetical protein